MNTWDLEAERELWADICYKDFWQFCDYALGYGNNPAFKWWSKRVHRPFCDWFQQHAESWLGGRSAASEVNDLTYLMVVVLREFGKTMIITKAGQLWLHLHDPDLSTYIGSSTVGRAADFFTPMKVWLMGDDPSAHFTWLYGLWYDKNRSWTSDQLVHGARRALARSEPSIGTWGVETGLTSTHPDAGFIDDPVDYDLMAKDGKWLEKVNLHLISLTPVFKANALMVYIGTRYHDADPIGEQLRRNGAASVTGMSMPDVRATADGKWHVYFLPGRDLDGKPTFPENWNERRLREYERDNSMMYSAQIMNDPNIGAHVPLTANQIDSLWVDKRHVPSNLRYSVHLDTAFKSKESLSRGDESVIQVWGHTADGSGDVYYIEGHGSNRWRVDDFNNQLVILLQRLRSTKRWPFVLTDEAEIGGKYGTWALTLESWCHGAGIPCPPFLLLQRGGRKKVARIIQASAYWVDGHVKLIREAPGVDALVSQMLRIGNSPNDDWADAAADVFHPDIYRPARISNQRDVQPRIRRPWDTELQNGGLSDDELRMLYDASQAQEEGRPAIQ